MEPFSVNNMSVGLFSFIDNNYRTTVCWGDLYCRVFLEHSVAPIQLCIHRSGDEFYYAIVVRYSRRKAVGCCVILKDRVFGKIDKLYSQLTDILLHRYMPTSLPQLAREWEQIYNEWDVISVREMKQKLSNITTVRLSAFSEKDYEDSQKTYVLVGTHNPFSNYCMENLVTESIRNNFTYFYIQPICKTMFPNFFIYRTNRRYYSPKKDIDNHFITGLQVVAEKPETE